MIYRTFTVKGGKWSNFRKTAFFPHLAGVVHSVDKVFPDPELHSRDQRGPGLVDDGGVLGKRLGHADVVALVRAARHLAKDLPEVVQAGRASAQEGTDQEEGILHAQDL